MLQVSKTIENNVSRSTKNDTIVISDLSINNLDEVSPIENAAIKAKEYGWKFIWIDHHLWNETIKDKVKSFATLILSKNEEQKCAAEIVCDTFKIKRTACQRMTKFAHAVDLQNVALPTTYLNDIRFDQRRGSEGMTFITDSSQKGPNGIIIVDLASGQSWRRLNDHPSTKAQELHTFMPIVEGRPFLEHQPDGSVRQGADGIANSSDGTRLFYCPLGSRKLYSVDTDALADLSRSERCGLNSD